MLAAALKIYACCFDSPLNREMYWMFVGSVYINVPGKEKLFDLG